IRIYRHGIGIDAYAGSQRIGASLNSSVILKYAGMAAQVAHRGETELVARLVVEDGRFGPILPGAVAVGPGSKPAVVLERRFADKDVFGVAPAKGRMREPYIVQQVSP